MYWNTVLLSMILLVLMGMLIVAGLGISMVYQELRSILKALKELDNGQHGKTETDKGNNSA